MGNLDENLLDGALEAVNKEETLSTLGRWKDQLNLLLEAGFKEDHAIKMICQMMLSYIPQQ